MHHVWIEPRASATSPRVWMLLHGAGARAESEIKLLAEAADSAGAHLVAPQATRPSGEGFAWSFAADAEAIAKMLDVELTRRGLVDAPIEIIGLSMGCTMGLWLLLRQPRRYRSLAAVGMGSSFERWELDDGGIDETALSLAAKEVRVLLAVDLRDPAGDPPHVAGYFARNLAHLQRIGFSVETFRPDEGVHEFTPAMRRRVIGFLTGG
jgi:pimeloyl-ACP methyl ester carboxylesterase